MAGTLRCSAGSVKRSAAGCGTPEILAERRRISGASAGGPAGTKGRQTLEKYEQDQAWN
jgi:hypothetical protein